MELSGWIFLIGAWSIIIYLTIFCFVRVFGLEKGNNQKQKDNSDENTKTDGVKI